MLHAAAQYRRFTVVPHRAKPIRHHNTGLGARPKQQLSRAAGHTKQQEQRKSQQIGPKSACQHRRFHGLVGYKTKKGSPGDKPVSVLAEASGSHSSRPYLTIRFKQPTREFGGTGRPSSPIWSCSAWGLPCQSGYPDRGALLPHLFTLTPAYTGAVYSLLHFPSRNRHQFPARPLTGTLPYGDRTFLPPTLRPKPEYLAGGCLSGEPTCTLARCVPME